MAEYVAMVAILVAVVSLVIGLESIARLQQRVIILEMKIRCAELLPAGHDAELARLTPKQIVALSGASDQELGGLLDRAAREQLTPELILKAIK